MKRLITIAVLLIALSGTVQAKAIDDAPTCTGFWLKCLISKIVREPLKIIVIKPPKR